MIFNPFFLFKVVLCSFLSVFILRAIFFLSFPEIGFYFIFYYWILVFSILAGIILGGVIFLKPNSSLKTMKFSYSNRAGDIITFLAFIWLMVFVVYLTQKMDTVWGKTLTEIRYEKMNQEVNASFLGVILDLFSFFCVIQFLLTFSQSITWRKVIFSSITLLACLVYNLLTGGRIGVFLIFIYICIFVISLGYLKKLSVRYKALIFIAILSLLVYSSHIFIAREFYRGRSIEQGIGNFITTYFLSGSSPTSDSSFYFILVAFWCYLTHAVNEFYYLFSSNIEHWHGVYSFYKVFYALHLLGWSDFDLHQLSNLDRNGVYLGLLGGSYLDFGNFTFVYLFFIGFFASFFHIKFIQTRDYRYLFTFLTFFTLFVCAPIISIINSANGMSMIFCSLSYYAVSIVKCNSVIE